MNIEEGCLAMIIKAKHSENNGKTVTVLKFAGSPDDHVAHGDWWLTDGLFYSFNTLGIPSKPTRYAREYNLMRIDGYEDVAETDREPGTISSNRSTRKGKKIGS